MSAPRIVLAMAVATVVAVLALVGLGIPGTLAIGQPGTARLAAAPSPPASQPTAASAVPTVAEPSLTPSPRPVEPEKGVAGAASATPDASQPTLALAPRAAGPGAQVKLTGAGFAPAAHLAATLVGAGQAAARQLPDVTPADDGALSETIALPEDLAPGRYTLRLATAGSGNAQADLWVVDGEPRLDLRRYAAHPGELLDLMGAGFAPGEKVRVYLADAPSAVLGELSADTQGAVASQAIAVPGVPAGVHTLVAEGEQTGVTVRRDVSVVEHTPWMVLSTYALRPGGAVDVAGHDFAPGEPVQAFLDDARTPPWTSKADNVGAVVGRELFAARPDGVGKHRITLAGDTTRAPVSATFEVLPFVPRLALTRYAGPPGDGVAFDGVGFAPGETVRVYLERGAQRDQVATITAGTDGAFQGAGAYAVPGGAGVGKLHFVALGDASRAPVSQDYDVQALAPWAELSAYSGAADAALSFRGRGFSPGERVDVHLGALDGPVLGTATSDSQGAIGWSGPVSLPADQGPGARLLLVGAASGSHAQAEYDVVAPPTVASR